MPGEINNSQLLQGALNTPQSVLNSGLAAALEEQANSKNFNPAFALDLVNNLAKASPEVKAQLGDLYQANLQDVLKNPAQVVRLQQICKQLTKKQWQEKLHSNLEKLTNDTKQQVQNEKIKYAQEWREYLENSRKNTISSQKKAITDETNDTLDKGISGRKDKSLFDISALGQFYQLLVEQGFIVPLDERLYSSGFTYVAAKDNEYVKQLSAEHGNTTVFPNMPRP